MPKYRPMKSPVRRPGRSGLLIWPRRAREQAEAPPAKEWRPVRVREPAGWAAWARSRRVLRAPRELPERQEGEEARPPALPWKPEWQARGWRPLAPVLELEGRLEPAWPRREATGRVSPTTEWVSISNP